MAATDAGSAAAAAKAQTTTTSTRRSTTLGRALVALIGLAALAYLNVRHTGLRRGAEEFSASTTATTKRKRTRRQRRTRMVSPACRPRYPNIYSSNGNNRSNGSSSNNGGNGTLTTTQPKIRRIVFSHMRKAGGSSLRRYFASVAKLYNLKYEAVEGYSSNPPEYPRKWNDDEKGEERGSTLYVTNLRDPISRSLSHFRYEGRWNCRDVIKWYVANYTKRHPTFRPKIYKSIKNLNHSEVTFYPTRGNAEKIESWYHSAGHEEEVCPVPRGNKKRKLWKCASDCYVRWFTDEVNCMSDLTDAYRRALDVLYRYDLIVIAERLSDPSYVRDLEGMFGVTGLVNQPMWCGDESQAANQEVPLVVNDGVVERLRRVNEEDLELYGEMTTCPDGIVFPRFNPSRFASR